MLIGFLNMRNRLFCLLNGDKAGKQAAERSLSVLLSFGLTPKILRLEEGMDPDSFIRLHGEAALQQKADSAQDLFLYLFLKVVKKIPRRSGSFLFDSKNS